MKKIWSILLFFSLCNTNMLAQLQEVISSSGGYFSNSQGSMSFTLGEYMINTYKSSSLILTQGFNQTFLPTPTGIEDLIKTSDAVTAFPNPVLEAVTVLVKDHRGLSLTLYDVNGTVLTRQKIVENETNISFKELVPAVYILKVFKESQEIMTFKIVKQ